MAFCIELIHSPTWLVLMHFILSFNPVSYMQVLAQLLISTQGTDEARANNKIKQKIRKSMKLDVYSLELLQERVDKSHSHYVYICSP